MSTTNIIKGYANPNEAPDVIIWHEQQTPLGEHSPTKTATLIIGTGKVWTEEEVQAELARKDAEIEALRNPWISVKDRLPEPGLPVIAFVTDPKNPEWSRRIRAVYAEEGTLELGEAEPWDGCTCDEETGDWFCQPGWYEHNWYEDTNWRVTDTVTHWIPLPTPPQP